MRATEDTYLHKGMRKKMVDSIREMGISDEAVLGAMMNVPRHFFLDSAFEKHAYEEKAFLIGEDQTISHPYTVAFQTQLLGIKPFDKILEVGTGSAYQACILAELKSKVFTIERQKKLFEGNKN
jgi:protein-L-isoaspartate(D-aspartate) O-methyltransferase